MPPPPPGYSGREAKYLFLPLCMGTAACCRLSVILLRLRWELRGGRSGSAAVRGVCFIQGRRRRRCSDHSKRRLRLLLVVAR